MNNNKSIYYYLLAFLVFAVYLYTMHPTISPYRDSGDLIVASYTMGIAHPPGYPLYALSGKVFTLALPWGNIAYRVNIMSAFFGAAAFVFMAYVVRAALGPSVWLLLPLLTLAFSPAYWRLSQVSEMYSINAFFAALIIFIAARFFIPGGRERIAAGPPLLYLLGFACGFAAGNHQTIILFYPALLWFLWRGKEFSPKEYGYAALFFAAGLSIYAYLPIRSATEPLADWGNPENLSGFFRMITRADYGGMRLHPEQSKFSWSAGIIIQHLWVYLKSLGGQFTWPGAAAGLLGMYLTRKNRFFRFLFWSVMLSGPAFIIFSNLPPAEKTTLPILEPHLVMPNLFFAFFISAALARFVSAGWAKALCVLLPLAVFAAGEPKCNYRNHFFAYDYGRNLFSTIPEGGMIYNPDDATAFITSYFQVAGKKREDIKLAAYFRTRWGYELLKNRSPEILPQREIASGRELETVLLDFNRGKRQIFAELPVKYPEGYNSLPYGMLYGLQSKKMPAFSGMPFEFYSMRNRCVTDDNFDFFTNHVISYYSSARANLGLAYAEAGQYGRAREEYKRALAIDPGLEPAKNNMGTLEYYLKNYSEAEKWFLQILKDAPDNPSALFNLGLTYKAGKKTELAEECFRKAWERNGSPEAGNELGLMLLNSGRTEQSIAVFGELLKRDPRYRYAYYNMGLALKQAGRFNESYSYFKVYLDSADDPREREEVMGLMKGLS
ncbi:MAG: DUF2723 domain-containing protein, partial [Elusimicrobiota bacterium]